jgi:hypothetical protein
MQARVPRAKLPLRSDAGPADDIGITHDQLLDALRAVDGLVDLGGDPPNFHFRSRPFLHFHFTDQGMYADVRFDRGDFEPVWVATHRERQELLARVTEHVERLQASRKTRRRSRRERDD